jgi:hypothetical protein
MWYCLFKKILQGTLYHEYVTFREEMPSGLDENSGTAMLFP